MYIKMSSAEQFCRGHFCAMFMSYYSQAGEIGQGVVQPAGGANSMVIQLFKTAYVLRPSSLPHPQVYYVFKIYLCFGMF